MRKTMALVALVGLIATGRTALADDKPSCDQVLAQMEKAGGSLSADEVAKKMGTTPERVRECMAKTKDGAAPQPAPGGAH